MARLAELGVLHNGAVAAEVLLECLEHLLVVDSGVDALFLCRKRK